MTDLVALLSRESGLPISDLMRIISTAPRRYKVYTVPKKSGGTRIIAQPAREVKALQRLLIQHVLLPMPVHQAATAYRKGTSIQTNASAHSGSGPILKLDFKDFFPSVRSEDWEAYAGQNTELSPSDISIMSQLLFRKARGETIMRLSIGAPSSPILSNILLFDFDTLVTSEAARRRISYTRYADDLTFSGQRIGMLKDMIDIVQKTLRQMQHPKIHLNADKTTYVTAAFRRTVTGVVLANDGSLSLGREKKRLLSAKIHHALHAKLTQEEMAQLAGHLAFVNVIEPTFIARLVHKYGPEIVSNIQKSVRVPKKSTGSSSSVP